MSDNTLVLKVQQAEQKWQRKLNKIQFTRKFKPYQKNFNIIYNWVLFWFNFYLFCTIDDAIVSLLVCRLPTLLVFWKLIANRMASAIARFNTTELLIWSHRIILQWIQSFNIPLPLRHLKKWEKILKSDDVCVYETIVKFL